MELEGFWDFRSVDGKHLHYIYLILLSKLDIKVEMCVHSEITM